VWSSHPEHARSRARGFSLLEVLVAFVIISLVATAIFRLFSGALANAGAAEEYSRAVLIAQSVQAEALLPPLHEETRTGDADDGRVQWTVQIAPYDPPDVNPDLQRASANWQLRLYRVVTNVTFAGPNGGQRNVTLDTIRLGAREPQ
jgi:general secretion pathway protein I